jgi:hypothetical protein
MDGEQSESDLESQRRLEELRAQVDALQARANEANHRADASEARADENHRRIDKLEVRADVDQQMIADLQADGVLSKEHAAHLEEALRSSRKIGAAIGIVMANRNVSEEIAFDILRRASNHANRRVRVLADEVVRTGDVSDLPSA